MVQISLPIGNPFVCEVCGAEFVPHGRRSPNRFCSMSCYDRYRASARLKHRPCRVPGCSRLEHVRKHQLCWRHYAYQRAHGHPENRTGNVEPLALSPTDAAWIAGILDGEGYLGILRQPCSTHIAYGIRVSVNNTCPRMIHHLHSLTGTGRIGYREPQGNARPQWKWTLENRQDVKRLLLAVLPYLITKQEQARVMLEFPDLHSKCPEERERLYQAVAALNRRGLS